MEACTPVPDDRPLTLEESTLIRWLLEHGNGESRAFFPQLDAARVASRCSCGCASIGFAVGGHQPSYEGGLKVLSDYEWETDLGVKCGVMVFAKQGVLAGLEVWSHGGGKAASKLPSIASLAHANAT